MTIRFPRTWVTPTKVSAAALVVCLVLRSMLASPVFEALSVAAASALLISFVLRLSPIERENDRLHREDAIARSISIGPTVFKRCVACQRLVPTKWLSYGTCRGGCQGNAA